MASAITRQLSSKLKSAPSRITDKARASWSPRSTLTREEAPPPNYDDLALGNNSSRPNTAAPRVSAAPQLNRSTSLEAPAQQGPPGSPQPKRSPHALRRSIFLGLGKPTTFRVDRTRSFSDEEDNADEEEAHAPSQYFVGKFDRQS